MKKLWKTFLKNKYTWTSFLKIYFIYINQFTRKCVVALLGTLIGIVIALPCVAAGNEFSCSKQVKLILSYFQASKEFIFSWRKRL